MARLKLNEYIDIGTIGIPMEVSWQVAVDSGFTNIIDESLNDTVNIFGWITPLCINPQDPPENRTYHKDLSTLYGRVRIDKIMTSNNGVEEVADLNMDWFVMDFKSQLNPVINVTKNGVIIDTINE